MAENMKVSTKTIKNKDKALFTGQMAGNMLAAGKMASSMDKANTILKMVRKK